MAIPVETTQQKPDKLPCHLCHHLLSGLVQRQVAGEGVDLLGGKRFEGEAGVGGLAVELGVARVSDERNRKAELAAAGGKVEQLLFGVHVDADLGHTRIEPVREWGGVALVVIEPGPAVGGLEVGCAALAHKGHEDGFDACVAGLRGDLALAHLEVASHDDHLLCEVAVGSHGTPICDGDGASYDKGDGGDDKGEVMTKVTG